MGHTTPHQSICIVYARTLTAVSAAACIIPMHAAATRLMPRPDLQIQATHTHRQGHHRKYCVQKAEKLSLEARHVHGYLDFM